MCCRSRSVSAPARAGMGRSSPVTPKIDTGDTAFLLVSAALVMLMTPGLALFYGGMVVANERARNAHAELRRHRAHLGAVDHLRLQSVVRPDMGGIIGSLDWAFLRGVGTEPNADYAATVPHIAFS